MRRRRLALIGIMGALGLLTVGLAWRSGLFQPPSSSNDLIREYLLFPQRRPAMANHALTRCPGAPFVLPSAGLIGLMYGDTARPYSHLRRHTGIDIFGDGAPGTVPVFAMYDGWLTRLPEWRSTVILRHVDPLVPGGTIWSYYTHMASRDGATSFVAERFPPGTRAMPVQQGDLLGYQGEFAGAVPPIAMHLHVSITRSDGAGGFLNEALLENTLDPSPYLGFALRLADEPQRRPLSCR